MCFMQVHNQTYYLRPRVFLSVCVCVLGGGGGGGYKNGWAITGPGYAGVYCPIQIQILMSHKKKLNLTFYLQKHVY